MFVRTANPGDAERIAQIHVDTRCEAYRGLISDAVLDGQSIESRVKFWRERLDQDADSVFVAQEQGVVGFCNLIPSRDMGASQSTGEIATLYVLASHWRMGAGRMLCHRALAEAWRRGCAVVTLWVLASNENARRFYEAMGFSLDGGVKTEKESDGSESQEVRFLKSLG
jgi:ribosomal protein S18 acetylase RimI-like enzyme